MAGPTHEPKPVRSGRAGKPGCNAREREWTVDVDDEAAGAMDANGRTLDEIKAGPRSGGPWAAA